MRGIHLHNSSQNLLNLKRQRANWNFKRSARPNSTKLKLLNYQSSYKLMFKEVSKNISKKLKNISKKLKNISKKLKNISKKLKNISKKWKFTSLRKVSSASLLTCFNCFITISSPLLLLVTYNKMHFSPYVSFNIIN